MMIANSEQGTEESQYYYVGDKRHLIKIMITLDDILIVQYLQRRYSMRKDKITRRSGCASDLEGQSRQCRRESS